MVRMHARETPPSPRQLNRQVPADLANLVVRALQKDAQLRYASAAEMEVALSTLEKDYAVASMESNHSDLQPAVLDFKSLLKVLFAPGVTKNLVISPWQIAGRRLPFGVVLAFLAALAFVMGFALLYAAVNLVR